MLKNEMEKKKLQNLYFETNLESDYCHLGQHLIDLLAHI
jgi:hypothetical protein